MGQDQSNNNSGGGSNNNNNNKQQHVDPNNNRTNNNATKSATGPASTAPSRDASQSPRLLNRSSNNNNNNDFISINSKLIQNDDAVLAILRQLENIELPYPILKSTGVPPEQEVAALSLTTANSSSSSSSKTSSPQTTSPSFRGGDKDSSPTLESISNFLSDLKKKAQSASNQLIAPTFRERNAEVKNSLQQPQHNNSNNQISNKSSSPPRTKEGHHDGKEEEEQEPTLNSVETSRAASPSSATETKQQSLSQQPHHLASLPAPPLLQTLGRPQTLNLREIQSNSVPRCERMQHESAKLQLEMQGLKSAALQQIRLGQKCYGVETEVKRLHLEVHGDDKGSPAARSIGHEGSFPSLVSVCDETAELLDKVHALLGEEPKKVLQEYAMKIEAREPASPVLSPLRRRM